MDMVRYTRLFADESGESHFQCVEVGLKAVKPSQTEAINIAEPFEARRLNFFNLPADWQGGRHADPRKRFFFVMEGECELEASDGEARRFGPGSIINIEDTSGEGHITRILGDAAFLAVTVDLE